MYLAQLRIIRLFKFLSVLIGSPFTSILSETLSGNMDGIRRLPKELYSLLIDKYFDQSSCVAIALSGGFDGFSPVYTSSRFTLI